MPVDRKRRNLIASHFATYLRGDSSFAEFVDHCGKVAQASPRHALRRPQGFSMGDLPWEVDEVLDVLTPICIHVSMQDAHNGHHDRAIGRFTRTLAMFRSDLDTSDATLPKPPTVERRAIFKILVVAFLSFLLTIVPLVVLENPYCLAIWPVVGTVLFFQNRFLVQRHPLCLNDDVWPFLTPNTRDSAMTLVPELERKSFRKTLESPLKTNTKPKFRLSRVLLVSFSTALSVITALGLTIFVASVFVVAWPYFLFDKVRGARRELSR